MLEPMSIEGFLHHYIARPQTRRAVRDDSIPRRSCATCRKELYLCLISFTRRARSKRPILARLLRANENSSSSLMPSRSAAEIIMAATCKNRSATRRARVPWIRLCFRFWRVREVYAGRRGVLTEAQRGAETDLPSRRPSRPSPLCEWLASAPSHRRRSRLPPPTVSLPTPRASRPPHHDLCLGPNPPFRRLQAQARLRAQWPNLTPQGGKEHERKMRDFKIHNGMFCVKTASSRRSRGPLRSFVAPCAPEVGHRLHFTPSCGYYIELSCDLRAPKDYDKLQHQAWSKHFYARARSSAKFGTQSWTTVRQSRLSYTFVSVCDLSDPFPLSDPF